MHVKQCDCFIPLGLCSLRVGQLKNSYIGDSIRLYLQILAQRVSKSETLISFPFLMSISLAGFRPENVKLSLFPALQNLGLENIDGGELCFALGMGDSGRKERREVPSPLALLQRKGEGNGLP